MVEPYYPNEKEIVLCQKSNGTISEFIVLTSKSFNQTYHVFWGCLISTTIKATSDNHITFSINKKNRIAFTTQITTITIRNTLIHKLDDCPDKIFNTVKGTIQTFLNI